MHIFFRFIINCIKKILSIFKLPFNILSFYFYFPKKLSNGIKLAQELEDNNFLNLSLKSLIKLNKKNLNNPLINFMIGDILFYRYKNKDPSDYYFKFFSQTNNININDKSFSYYPPSIYNTKINRNINILDEIFKYQKQFPTNRYSDKKQINIYKYYQSEHNLHLLDQFKDLKIFLEKHINDNIFKAFFGELKKKIYINKMWFVISSKGVKLAKHNHSEGVFSGILYLKVPNQHKQVGQLILSNPQKNINLINQNIDQKIIHKNNEIIIEPINNNLIVFNSYIKHSVENQATTEDRISLPFDLSIGDS